MNYYPHGRGVSLNVCEWSMGVVGNTQLIYESVIVTVQNQAQ